jgi:hypothetical protein
MVLMNLQDIGQTSIKVAQPECRVTAVKVCGFYGSHLSKLGASRQGRSMLFSDEQKFLFEGWKKRFVMNSNLDFYETLTKPIMRVI